MSHRDCGRLVRLVARARVVLAATAALGMVIAAPRGAAGQPTFTPIETFTPFRTFTPDQTFTPIRTFTPIQTFTPFPSPSTTGHTRTVTVTPKPSKTATASASVTPTAETPTRTRTHTRMPTQIPSVTAGVLLCTGDCNGDTVVSIDELIVGVRAALGLGSLGVCTSLDADANLVVTVDELVAAVNQALAGCP